MAWTYGRTWLRIVCGFVLCAPQINDVKIQEQVDSTILTKLRDSQKNDKDTLDQAPLPIPEPPPTLYKRARHRRHRRNGTHGCFLNLHVGRRRLAAQ
jgi:hypothetical protein